MAIHKWTWTKSEGDYKNHCFDVGGSFESWSSSVVFVEEWLPYENDESIIKRMSNKTEQFLKQLKVDWNKYLAIEKQGHPKIWIEQIGIISKRKKSARDSFTSTMGREYGKRNKRWTASATDRERTWKWNKQKNQADEKN